MDARGELVLSMATAKPGVLVSAPAIRPTTLGVSISNAYFSPTAVRQAEQNNKHSDENKRLSFATERIEESGPCLNTDGKNEEHQAEIS